jgi:hypothetical protein
MVENNCQCRQCLRDRKEGFDFGTVFVPAERMMMVICCTCGDKRCPHAEDHRNECADVDIDAVLNGAFALTERRLWLCKNVPVCPACGEKIQIQLVDWSVTPADWKCRACKHKWQFEPVSS